MLNLSLKIHAGRPDMPAVVLIHGLGMNNYFWVDPEKCHVLGGLAPLTIFLAEGAGHPDTAISFGTADPDLRGLWTCLENCGFSLASWSQQQPLGPIRVAIEELRGIMSQVREQLPDRPVYLVGHSRGGLIARRYLLEEEGSDIAGLVTICSPHAGTGMAKFSRYLKPIGHLLEKIVPAESEARLVAALCRLSVFLQSPAIEELTPDAKFIATLGKPLPEGLRKLSFGGTNPSLFQLVVRFPKGRYRIINFSDLLAGAVPTGHLPPELTPGSGDALVSAESSRLAGARHFDFPDNHVRAAFDHKIQTAILDFLNNRGEKNCQRGQHHHVPGAQD